MPSTHSTGLCGCGTGQKSIFRVHCLCLFDRLQRYNYTYRDSVVCVVYTIVTEPSVLNHSAQTHYTVHVRCMCGRSLAVCHALGGSVPTLYSRLTNYASWCVQHNMVHSSISDSGAPRSSARTPHAAAAPSTDNKLRWLELGTWRSVVCACTAVEATKNRTLR